MKLSLARKGLTPAGHLPFSDLFGQARTDGNGLQLSDCAKV